MDAQAPTLLESLINQGIAIGLNILLALFIFLIGKWVAGLLKKTTHNVLTRHKVEATLVKFVANLVYIVLLIFIILAVLNRLGIQTTSFVAVLASAGLAVGLALQGGLANFAAGVLLIIFRPFKVGDYIEGAGTAGIVEAIQIFTTQLRTPDNKTIIIPNASLTAGNITNYSSKPTRRLDLVFGCGYQDDLSKVKKVLENIVANDKRVLADPAPQVVVSELGDSSVNFAVRPWVNADDYWDVYFDMTETVKRRFDEEGIAIPFPQRDVHIYQHT